MRETNHKEPEFDDLDAAIAAALGDASAWPVPRDGFEERCAARVEEILQADQTRRPFRLFGWTPFLKLAASFAVVLGTASLVYNAVVGSHPPAPESGGAEMAHCGEGAATDIAVRCERMARMLEKEKSRRAATRFLAKVCAENGI